MAFSGKKYITRLINRANKINVFAALLMFLCIFCEVHGQNVPTQYKKYFKQYNADDKALWKRILESLGYNSDALGRSYALVAGIDYYPNLPPASRSLKPAGKDLENLVNYLKNDQQFDEIILLRNDQVTPENLRFFLYQYLPEQIKDKRKSRFLFAYSGHGITISERGYLLTDQANSLDDRKNSINLSSLKVQIDEIVDVSHYNLVLINSCYSGSFIYRTNFGDNLVPKGKGAHAITAGNASQLTQALSTHGEGSIFFEKFFEGVKGKADNDGKGVITVTEIFNYIHQEVSKATNEKQVPQLGDFSKNGSVGQFFFLNSDKIKRPTEESNTRVGSLPTTFFGDSETPIVGFIPKSELDDWVRDNDLAELKRYAEQGSAVAQRRLGRIYSFRYQDDKTAFKWYLKAADQGDANAQNNLASLYMSTDKDYERALYWFRKAAEQNYFPSQRNIGYLYSMGHGVEQDYKVAISWYQKAADQGFDVAQADLGFMYSMGYGVEQDYKIAASWYQKAADQGNAPAQSGIGYLYQSGQGVEQDFNVAMSWYQKAADQGFDEAQGHLGYMYREGLGVEIDYGISLSWYRKAADQENFVAQGNLGFMYATGLGVEQDYEVALSWYQKAAEQNYAPSQRALGLVYQNGLGVKQDYKVAISWYQKAADQGFDVAQADLGFMYSMGYGVEQDYKIAASWYQKAADQGNAQAQSNIGYLYQSGQGVEQDYKVAVSWYQKAADQGNAIGQFNLGNCYHQGIGVFRNLSIARTWWEKACNQDLDAACQNLRSVKNY